MAASTHKLPIARRLVGRYLMFGLAGILSCTTLIVTFEYFGTVSKHLAFAVAAELCLLLAGAIVIERSVRVSQAIEQQLHDVSTVSPSDTPKLEPLAEADPIARGWNAVIEHLKSQRITSTLESRICEQAGRADEKRLERIFQALSEGVAACKRDGTIVTSNNAFSALLGASSDEQAQQNIFTLLNDYLKDSTSGLPEHAYESTAPFTTELRSTTETGQRVVRVRRIPMLDDQSESGGCLWTFRDVTQQKMAEEVRNQFVYTATHELRTPLANIKAYAETLALSDDIDVRDQKNFYNVIMNEATRLSRFIDELLNVNQMESGAVTLVRGEIDVERMLGEVIENLQPQIKHKELQFESHFAAKLPKLYVDKDKLVAALVNLLGNAVKYTPNAGTVRFTVEVDETVVSFHIEDTGIGISSAELPRIMEKFFRSSDDRVRNVVGSGLGLAFAQEVARLHGGMISVKSELNKGSRFTLNLPIDQGAERHVPR